MAGRDYAGSDEFVARHLGPRESDLADMLAVVGAASLDDLVDRVVPSHIREDGALALPEPLPEAKVLARARDISRANVLARNFIGQGYHGTLTPPVIQRNVLENPAWYTAYTPYQPEISQGRLEALLVFQTMICELSGMTVANASLLDEATAAAEAMALAHRNARTKSPVFLVSSDCHPQTIAVVRTRAEPIGIEVHVGALEDLLPSHEACFGVLAQYPGTTGEIRDLRPLTEAARGRKALFIVATDILSLALLRPPGEQGADIVVGSAQRFGVPMGFGGPHAAFIACGDALKRQLPGRLVGVSVDAGGRTALRLALQTREQHIRREKATSNICTAQVLLAVIAAMYAVYHGPEGLRRIATHVNRLARRFASGARSLGMRVVTGSFFDTVTFDAADDRDRVLAATRDAGMNLRDFGANGLIGATFDESHAIEDVERLLAVMRGGHEPAARAPTADDEASIPEHLRRHSPCLAHPVFLTIRSETEMLRYLRRLSDRDLALDRTMIPLGSCTMKLNATTEMVPITWDEFSGLHPFAPSDQTAGYARLCDELSRALCEITGYDAFSLQPNSGAQGEYAGLLAIRAYHRSRGDARRDICLIPASAHGTNPASAHMAGMEVVTVSCDERGNVDLTDLRGKATAHRDRLAALMVTYPSTHGVFEDAIREICDVVHQCGGQVYLDGANLNALVGVAKPGRFGADVSHLNLHKTFCIPHGGGGPGVGPIGVRAHLAPFLPGHPLRTDNAVGPVSAAPLGSAGILPISWAYVTLMGTRGLLRATQVAILNANYVAKRLAPHFPVLYSGHEGLVAHECILDLRPVKEATGITNEDVAKRLIDYGFHAPTMSFPVPGTLMVEPTESEARAELDRFCDAMIAIREEIRLVEDGKLPRDDNPLVNAPHTAEACLADDWTHPYGREQAAFPLAELRHRKYWSPVARVDNVYGDRHVACTCPLPED
ncbi:MAG: aminomethyl-transferring glycine dehydrogenase [Betaproteobacteria bacterium]|nr:aminomethyl-transferring glycine dehydrogenase [Betaproteobacteria bacterium]